MAISFVRLVAVFVTAALMCGCAALRDEAYTPVRFQASAVATPTPLAPLAPVPRSVASSEAEDFQCLDGSRLQVSYSDARDIAHIRVNGGAPIVMQRTDEAGLPAYRTEGLVFRRSGVRAALAGGESTVTVRNGDTLGAIALRAYGDRSRVSEIARENGIANPDLILVGQVLRMPMLERSCRRAQIDAASYTPGRSAAPSDALDRRLFSAPSRRQPDLRNIAATATDPPAH